MKIDAVLIVFLKSLKCLHIVCAMIKHLPIVHVHKFICAGLLRRFASYHHHHNMFHLLMTVGIFRCQCHGTIMGFGHGQWRNSIIYRRIFWAFIQLNDENIYIRKRWHMNYSSTVCHKYVLCSSNLRWNIFPIHQMLCIKIYHLEIFFTFPDFIGIIGNFSSI